MNFDISYRGWRRLRRGGKITERFADPLGGLANHGKIWKVLIRIAL